MPQESDRRQEARAAIELKVEYHRLNSFFYDYTKNISKGGTFIRTKHPLDVGTRFLFKLFIPTMGEPLVVWGEVRWVLREGDPVPPEHQDGGTEPGMGIGFVFEDDKHGEMVDKTVEHVMVASLGPRIYSRLRDALLQRPGS